ncbi:MAG: hypothetical protein ACPG61_07030 [Paracoccaceae bacterium]
MKNLTTAAAGPVTKEDFKRSIHMLEAETDDDDLIDDLIAAAVAVVDTGTAHPMAAADFEFDVPAGPWGCWWFPVRPVNSVAKVEVMDADGVWTGDDAGGAYVVRGHDEPRLILPDALAESVRAAQAVRVTANVGGAPTQQHRQAVILLVKEWRDAGIAVEKIDAADLSFHIRALMKQVRYRRPLVTT